MTTRLSLVAIGIVIVSVGVRAQVPGGKTQETTTTYLDPVNGLTLEEAVSRALEREPGLRAAQAQVEVARGLQAQAGLHPNPSLSFSQQEEPAGTDDQTRVEIQWPLDLFRKSGRVAVADREVDAAQQATANRARLLAASVRTKYGEVVTAVRTLSVTEELVAATTRQRTLVAVRVEQGATPPLDRDMLGVEVQRLEGERLVQAGNVERRLVELKRLLGLPPDAALSLRESLEQLVRRGQMPAASAAADLEALTSRADVRQAEAQVAVADAQIDRTRREGQLDVSLFGMYMRSDAGFPQRGVGPTGDLERVRGVFHYWSAGAMVTLPLLNRNQGAVAAAQAQRTAAAAQVDAVRLSAQSEVAAARVRDVSARRALDAYTAEAVGLARQNLDVVRQTYELGRGTLLDVLNEQRRYLDLERAYTDVLREAFDARQTLKEALGETR
jgi:cobalt-zinc-cadmium efflux system outer membrane protein